jgi:hypothetical protein
MRMHVHTWNVERALKHADANTRPIPGSAASPDARALEDALAYEILLQKQVSALPLPFLCIRCHIWKAPGAHA